MERPRNARIPRGQPVGGSCASASPHSGYGKGRFGGPFFLAMRCFRAASGRRRMIRSGGRPGDGCPDHQRDRSAAEGPALQRRLDGEEAGAGTYGVTRPRGRPGDGPAAFTTRSTPAGFERGRVLLFLYRRRAVPRGAAFFVHAEARRKGGETVLKSDREEWGRANAPGPRGAGRVGSPAFALSHTGHQKAGPGDRPTPSPRFDRQEEAGGFSCFRLREGRREVALFFALRPSLRQ